jgi:hypothetical protein
MILRLKNIMEKTLDFVERWTAIGGKCHIVSISDDITHVGEYQYNGKLMDNLRSIKNRLTIPRKPSKVYLFRIFTPALLLTI